MARRIPFDDPQVLTYVRMAYVATQVTVLGVYYYVGMQVRLLLSKPSPPILIFYSQIRKKNDQTVLKYGACLPSLRRGGRVC